MRATDSRDEPNELVKGLESLRISGDFQSLESAAKRIHQIGPIEVLTEAVNNIPVAGWTHTTAQANLQLLAAAGDLLEAEKATCLLNWCAQLASGEIAEFTEQVRPWFWVEYLATRAIAGLLTAAEDSVHDEVGTLLARQFGPEATIPIVDLNNVFEHLDYDRVNPATRESLWALAQRTDSHHGVAALRWLAANSHELALSEAINRAALRDLQTLPAVFAADPSQIDEDSAKLLIDWFEEMTETRLAAARQRRYAFGGYDGARLLTNFNLLFPQFGRWKAILELLREPLVDSRTKRNSCALLAIRAADIPIVVRDAIAREIDTISQAAPVYGDEPGIGGIGVMLKTGFETIGGDQATSQATQLAFGSRRDREDAALLLGSGQCPGIQPILAALAADQRFSVRRSVATATGKLVSTDPNSLITALAWKLANDQGSGLPAALLNGMLQTGQQTPASVDIAQHLRQHPSAQIKRTAQRFP